MSDPSMKHTCPTCDGLGYIRPGRKAPAPRRYCSETFDYSNCTALDMPRETCRLGHAIAFRVPADMQESEHGDFGWFRVGAIHRHCHDFESLDT